MTALVRAVLAFLCAALSGMGVGGGGLLLIYLTLFEDTAQREAQLYNLIFFLAASASSLILHTYRRNIRLPVVFWLSFGGVPGAIIGSLLSGAVGDSALGITLGAFLAVSGAVSLLRRGEREK